MGDVVKNCTHFHQKMMWNCLQFLCSVKVLSPVYSTEQKETEKDCIFALLFKLFIELAENKWYNDKKHLLMEDK